LKDWCRLSNVTLNKNPNKCHLYQVSGKLLNQSCEISGKLLNQSYEISGKLLNQSCEISGKLLNQNYEISGKLLNQSYEIINDGHLGLILKAGYLVVLIE
jgi:hypothetical protein